jgi:hypothetical protein
VISTIFYDDSAPQHSLPQSIFLAGPTCRSGRTAWREEALVILAAKRFTGTVVIPEFRDGNFADRVPTRFAGSPSPVPGMRDTSYHILVWETNGIEHAHVVLFWMPFGGDASGEDAPTLLGFTTRAEVSREIARSRKRMLPERFVVLGMPPNALSASHIRFHAHQAGWKIESSLVATVDAAIEKLGR